jgi:hypothetical protein
LLRVAADSENEDTVFDQYREMIGNNESWGKVKHVGGVVEE